MLFGRRKVVLRSIFWPRHLSTFLGKTLEKTAPPFPWSTEKLKLGPLLRLNGLFISLIYFWPFLKFSDCFWSRSNQLWHLTSRSQGCLGSEKLGFAWPFCKNRWLPFDQLWFVFAFVSTISACIWTVLSSFISFVTKDEPWVQDETMDSYFELQWK